MNGTDNKFSPLDNQSIKEEVDRRVTAERGAYGGNLPPSEPSPFSREKILRALDKNEDGDAWLFCQLHRGQFCFDRSSGDWYRFNNGSHWSKDSLGQYLEAMGKVISAYELAVAQLQWEQLSALKKGEPQKSKEIGLMIDSILKRLKFIHTLKRKESVLKLTASGESSLGIAGSEWDRLPWVLPCGNGVVDLKTGDLMPGRPDDYLLASAPTDYHGLEEDCPAWEEALSAIFNGRQDVIDYVWRILGYAISGRCTEHIFVLLFGPAGRNGKSTIVRVIEHVLGEILSGPVEAETFLTSKYPQNPGGPRADVMKLRGRRLCFASETGQNQRLSPEKVKLLTGGDRLSARAPHAREDVSWTPTHTVFISTNSRPDVADGDDALWSRIKVVKFTERFVDDPQAPNEHPRDPEIFEKLRAEAPGILGWMVRGCIAWQAEGLKPPDDVLAETVSYRADQDLVQPFVNEMCDVSPVSKERSNILFSAYTEWGEREGRYTCGRNKFTTWLKSRFDKFHDQKGSFYIGICLKPLV